MQLMYYLQKYNYGTIIWILSSQITIQIDDIVFEIGGKNKGQKQIEKAQKGFIVKDDIENGFANVIPLWAFGLNY